MSPVRTPVVARTPTGTWVYGVMVETAVPDRVLVASWKGAFEATAWRACRHPSARRFKRGLAWDLTHGIEWDNPDKARPLLWRCNVFTNQTRRQRQARRQLQEMATQPDTALQIKQELDKDPDLRDQLANLYVRALRTLEQAGWQEWIPYCARCGQPWDGATVEQAEVADCLRQVAHCA